MTRTLFLAGILLAAPGVLTPPAHASLIQEVSTTSALGAPLSFRAELEISGDTLTVTLSNTSTTSSAAPNDVLSSYYFDIVKGGGSRPTLVYESSSGDVWRVYKAAADVLQQAGADLKAVAKDDDTWQFKTMDALSSPFLGFGLGTVGNSKLTPNNFNGNVVGGVNYSIYAGEITTQNLDNQLLVLGQATFTFSGASGFSESDISRTSAFGLGTAPDRLITHAPEPATLALLALGGLGVFARIVRRTLK